MSTATDRTRLRLAKAVLAFLIAGTWLVGMEWRLWPVISWPMYSRAFDAHGTSVSVERLRAVDRDGRVHEVPVEAHYGPGRERVLEELIERALRPEDTPDRRAVRAYLSDILARALPGHDLAQVEIVRLRWDVDVTARPPLDPGSPQQAETLLRFEAP